MEKLPLLPIGIQTFSTIRTEQMLYIDKTQYIHQMIGLGSRFFLARPRRFGKSLLLSTLKEIFQGNKHDFKGLWIENHWDWEKKYPVLHLDMSNVPSHSTDTESALLGYMLSLYKLLEIEPSETNSSQRLLSELIHTLYRDHQQKLVVLIDEYDCLLTDVLDEPKKLKKHQGILKDFYKVLKSQENEIHFLLLTGVSKYGKMNVFSQLNNLMDLSLDDRFAQMLGYTQEELEQSFQPYLERFAQKEGISYEDTIEKIKYWYNGYSFDGKTTVYTPWSILNFCFHLKIRNYWYDTGTPTFLIKIMKQKGLPAYELEDKEGQANLMITADVGKIDLYALLYQTGYLTIKQVASLGGLESYTLAYPNQEVRVSYANYLLSEYTDSGLGELSTNIVIKIIKAIQKNDLATFFEITKIVFASIPYNIFLHHQEAYYQSVIYLVMTVSGLIVRGEEQTHVGRIDAILETDTHLYIFEFKMTTADEALAQIHARKYFEKYLHKQKEIVLVGAAFDEENKTLKEWKSETWRHLV